MMKEATEQVERSAADGAERIKRLCEVGISASPGRRLRAEGAILGMMATPHPDPRPAGRR